MSADEVSCNYKVRTHLLLLEVSTHDISEQERSHCFPESHAIDTLFFILSPKEKQTLGLLGSYFFFFVLRK